MPESAFQLRESVEIAAAPSRVFRAWADLAELIRWYPDRVVGAVQIGGELEFFFDSLGVAVTARVAALEPPRRLGWVANVGGIDQHVAAGFEDANGGCRVRVCHGGLRDSDEVAGTRSGWIVRLAILREYLERYDGQTRHGFAVLGLAPVSAVALFERYRIPDWLGDVTFGGVLTPWSMDVGSLHLSGEVIAVVPGRELAVRCAQIDGVLIFRSLPAPGGRLLGVEVMSWGSEGPVVRGLRVALELGVDELVAELGGGPVPRT